MFQYRTSLLRLSFPTIIRWVIIAGLWLRFFVSDITLSLDSWILVLGALSIYTIFITVREYQQVYVVLRSEKWHFFQVFADTILFSILYVLIGKPDSDLYLLYFLPLLIAAEHFKIRTVSLLFLLITISFIVSLALVSAQSQISSLMPNLLVRTVLPRYLLLLFAFFILFRRSDLLRRRTEELEAVRETVVKVTRNEILESRVDALLDTARNLLGARGSSLYLKVPGKELLTLVAVTGVDSDVFKPGYVLPYDEGSSGRVMSTGSPLIIDSYWNYTHRVLELSDFFGSIIEVPLMFGDEAIGVLGVFDDAEARHFTQQDIVTLERLAQYAAIAIHDLQLLERVQQQTVTMQALSAAGSSMVRANLDLRDMLTSVAEWAWNLASIDSKTGPLFACVMLVKDNYLELSATHPQKYMERFQALVGRIRLQKPPIGIVSRAVITKASQLVPDVALDENYVQFLPDARSELAVPINARDRTVGVIMVEHVEYNAFSNETRENLEMLALQAASGIDNIYLFRRIEEQRKQAENQLQAAIVASSMRDRNDVSSRILEALEYILPYSRAILVLIESDIRDIVAARNFSSIDIDEPLIRFALQDDSLVRKLTEYRRVLTLSPGEFDIVSNSGNIEAKAWVAIPLLFNNNLIGIIIAESLESDLYTEDRQHILELFFHHVSSVFQNAILSKKNAEKIVELTETKEDLESVLDYLSDQRNLALIGLVYGESIHYARNKLGMASTRAANIIEGMYGDEIEKIKPHVVQIKEYITDYLQVLNNTQKEALQSPIPTRMDLHKTLNGVVQSKKISRSINIVFDYRLTNSIIYAPETQLRQVFFVIIQNALDAMRDGKGILRMETQLVTESNIKFVRVSISDTGKGLSEYEKAHFFEMRSTERHKAEHKGTGMGLFWARSFIRSYSGNIDFETSPGKGTTVHILFPQDFGRSIKLGDLKSM